MKRLPVCAMALALLAGCVDTNMADLNQFIKESKANAKGRRLEPVPEPKPYKPLEYKGRDSKDPFAVSEFMRPKPPVIDLRNAPDQNREREPLEDFDLNSLTMVGLYERDGSRWALVCIDCSDKAQVESPEVHPVRVGNFMGKNYGQITEVLDDEIRLIETFQTQEGTWEKRNVSVKIKIAPVFEEKPSKGVRRSKPRSSK